MQLTHSLGPYTLPHNHLATHQNSSLLLPILCIQVLHRSFSLFEPSSLLLATTQFSHHHVLASTRLLGIRDDISHRPPLRPLILLCDHF